MSKEKMERNVPARGSRLGRYCAQFLKVEIALQFMQRFIVDFAGAMKPDEFAPPGRDRFEHDVEMGVEDRRVMLRARGIVDDRNRSALIAVQQLRMDEIARRVIGAALNGDELRLGHRRLGLA